MSEIEVAIQEFYDNAFHNSLKPNISVKSKALAIQALKQMQERNNECCEKCVHRITCPQELNVDGSEQEAFCDLDFCSRFQPKPDQHNKTDGEGR